MNAQHLRVLLVVIALACAALLLYLVDPRRARPATVEPPELDPDRQCARGTCRSAAWWIRRSLRNHRLWLQAVERAHRLEAERAELRRRMHARRLQARTRVDRAAVDSRGVWDTLAQCEASGDWAANTGNGFYGGLQFVDSTWDAYGGEAYAPSAHLASREQQIVIAERVLAAQGWQAWPACSARLGLR